MLTENADCKREATGKIFPVYRNIFGVKRATKNQHFVSITFRSGIIGFQNFSFSIVFIFWLACFANQHRKIEKQKLFIVYLQSECIENTSLSYVQNMTENMVLTSYLNK